MSSVEFVESLGQKWVRVNLWVLKRTDACVCVCVVKHILLPLFYN